MFLIARSELVQLLRNRSVLVSSLIMPVAAAAFFIIRREDFEEVGGLGYIAAVLVFTVASFALYSGTVSTLAARRQTLFLKRLRTTAAGDPAIVSGLVLPLTAISLVQAVSILGVFAAVADRPADLPLLALAIAAAFVMMLALALATAGVTRSPEHAQVTALPLGLGTVLVASWVGSTGTEDLAWVKRLLPGGSATELIVEAWDGGVSRADSLVALAPTAAWAVVAIALASRMFRWEPRA